MLLSAQKEYVIDEYRPTLACHASTVLPLENGEVLAAWFGGTAEGKDDVDIYVSRRVGALWYPPQHISAGDVPHWNPVLFRGADGRIILYFKAGKPIPQWQTYFCESADGGKTWSAPAELVPGDTSGGRGPVKNKPLRLADGTILAPASTEQGAWLAFIDVSRDDGRTWTRTPNIPAPRYKSGRQIAMIQPTLWESAPNAVHALFRTNRGRIYRSDSADGGNGRSWGERAPLLLSVSEDNGATWREVLTLERRRTPDDEFSYPAVVSDGNALHITYTYQRQKIVYWNIVVDETEAY